jgi:hypothetical protein
MRLLSLPLPRPAARRRRPPAATIDGVDGVDEQLYPLAHPSQAESRALGGGRSRQRDRTIVRLAAIHHQT